jgi:hypothetical protein
MEKFNVMDKKFPTLSCHELCNINTYINDINLDLYHELWQKGKRHPSGSSELLLS